MAYRPHPRMKIILWFFKDKDKRLKQSESEIEDVQVN